MKQYVAYSKETSSLKAKYSLYCNVFELTGLGGSFQLNFTSKIIKKKVRKQLMHSI